MNKIKTQSYLIAGGWILYVALSLIYYPRLLSMMANSGFIVGTIIYLLTNPAYLLLIYYIIRYTLKSKIKASIASILIIFSFDMVASPRVMVEELLTTGSSTVTNMGAIAMKSMVGLGFPHKLAWYLYYVILPILFFVIAMELLGVVDFAKRMKKGVL